MNRFVAALASMNILLISAAAFAQQGGTTQPSGPGPRQFYFYHPPMFHGGGIVLGFLVLFALIGFFTVLYLVVRIATRGSRWRRGPYGGRAWGGPSGGSALSILEERLARGEIDKTEFEDKRKLLSRE